MTKESFIKDSKQHFKNEDVDLMYVTSDGHWFGEAFKNDADNHVNGKASMTVHTITRAESLSIAKEKAPVEEPKETGETEVSAEDQAVIDAIAKEEAGKNNSSESKSDGKPKIDPKKKGKGKA